MKKTQTVYYKNFGNESVTITVNEELPPSECKPIKIEMYERWWNPIDAIKYFENVIECIKELES